MFTVDRLSRTPIYEQIVEQFKDMIIQGELTEDVLLPSIRNLSQALSVNPNTLQKAYAQLEQQGICYSVPGNGRYITKDAKKILYQDNEKQIHLIEEIVSELCLKGVSLEEIIDCVTDAYKRVQNMSEKQKLEEDESR